MWFVDNGHKKEHRPTRASQMWLPKHEHLTVWKNQRDERLSQFSNSWKIKSSQAHRNSFDGSQLERRKNQKSKWPTSIDYRKTAWDFIKANWGW